jgi:predicted dehydrogenase
VTGHLPGLRANKDIEVVAICTAHEETARAAAEANGIPQAFWDFDRFIKSPEFDLVIVSTRPTLRKWMVTAALESGKHVLSDCPLALNSADAESFKTLAEAKGLKTLVNWQQGWSPVLGRMIELVRSGYIGTPWNLDAQLLTRWFKPVPEEGMLGYKWLTESANGANAVNNLIGQMVDPLCRMLGDVSDVAGVSSCFQREWKFADGVVQSDNVDTTAFFLRFANGVIATISCGWVQAHSDGPGQGSRIDIYGSEGRLLLEAGSFFGMSLIKNTRLYGGRVGEEFGEIEVPSSDDVEIELKSLSDPMLELNRSNGLGLIHLVRAIRGEGEAHPNFADAYRAIRVSEAVEKSSAEERWIKL